jgi:hypothetical protein
LGFKGSGHNVREDAIDIKIPGTPRESILAAMTGFGREERYTLWLNWERNNAHHFAIKRQMGYVQS